ncbi:MAG: hypothetical protein EZS28_018222 [Streblomastix strix]|uniref:Uncharacterized protein n=1 Tax=Streblomastix strix TaxID=222440 RepID=A0A5J4VUB7_9EUKA|nr:MAG: hypothetical protein EZS28_018222 [Streblomastix strix]
MYYFLLSAAQKELLYSLAYNLDIRLRKIQQKLRYEIRFPSLYTLEKEGNSALLLFLLDLSKTERQANSNTSQNQITNQLENVNIKDIQYMIDMESVGEVVLEAELQNVNEREKQDKEEQDNDESAVNDIMKEINQMEQTKDTTKQQQQQQVPTNVVQSQPKSRQGRLWERKKIKPQQPRIRKQSIIPSQLLAMLTAGDQQLGGQLNTNVKELTSDIVKDGKVEENRNSGISFKYAWGKQTGIRAHRLLMYHIGSILSDTGVLISLFNHITSLPPLQMYNESNVNVDDQDDEDIEEQEGNQKENDKYIQSLNRVDKQIQKKLEKQRLIELKNELMNQGRLQQEIMKALEKLENEKIYKGTNMMDLLQKFGFCEKCWEEGEGEVNDGKEGEDEAERESKDIEDEEEQEDDSSIDVEKKDNNKDDKKVILNKDQKEEDIEKNKENEDKKENKEDQKEKEKESETKPEGIKEEIKQSNKEDMEDDEEDEDEEEEDNKQEEQNKPIVKPSETEKSLHTIVEEDEEWIEKDNQNENELKDNKDKDKDKNIGDDAKDDKKNEDKDSKQKKKKDSQLNEKKKEKVKKKEDLKEKDSDTDKQKKKGQSKKIDLQQEKERKKKQAQNKKKKLIKKRKYIFGTAFLSLPSFLPPTCCALQSGDAVHLTTYSFKHTCPRAFHKLQGSSQLYYPVTLVNESIIASQRLKQREKEKQIGKERDKEIEKEIDNIQQKERNDQLIMSNQIEISRSRINDGWSRLTNKYNINSLRYNRDIDIKYEDDDYDIFSLLKGTNEEIELEIEVEKEQEIERQKIRQQGRMIERRKENKNMKNIERERERMYERMIEKEQEKIREQKWSERRNKTEIDDRPEILDQNEAGSINDDQQEGNEEDGTCPYEFDVNGVDPLWIGRVSELQQLEGLIMSTLSVLTRQDSLIV